MLKREVLGVIRGLFFVLEFSWVFDGGNWGGGAEPLLLPGPIPRPLVTCIHREGRLPRVTWHWRGSAFGLRSAPEGLIMEG